MLDKTHTDALNTLLVNYNNAKALDTAGTTFETKAALSTALNGYFEKDLLQKAEVANVPRSNAKIDAVKDLADSLVEKDRLDAEKAKTAAILVLITAAQKLSETRLAEKKGVKD